jgi:hypothetical protein
MLGYPGRDESLDCTGRNLALVEKLRRRGHHIYTDNFYSSPVLFAELREDGFGACGTVRVNRSGLPAEMKASLSRGVCVWWP